jgi:hypothetical protein
MVKSCVFFAVRAEFLNIILDERQLQRVTKSSFNLLVKLSPCWWYEIIYSREVRTVDYSRTVQHIFVSCARNRM